MASSSSDKKPLIRIEKIREMLFNEEKYLMEFAEASIESFSEFSEQYQHHLLDRNMKDFQKAGHKIKPVAQLLELDQILSEYRNAKKLMEKNETDAALEESVQDVQEICNRVIHEFRNIIRDLS